jgi:hypothetical protein
MKINPVKIKAVSFTKDRAKKRIRFYFGNELIRDASKFKYSGIITRSELNWADHVNYTLRQAWKALYFITRLNKMGNDNTIRLAYAALVRPILEY